MLEYDLYFVIPTVTYYLAAVLYQDIILNCVIINEEKQNCS